jgi:DNA-binding NarL/FixJ family response regulator
MIRVVVADDQPLIRSGFAVFINAADDLTVVGEAGTGRAALDLARSERADVIVMDIRMPDLDGLAATRLLTADPDLAGVRVLILTTFEVDEYVFQALRAGASGFLGKSAEVGALLDAIRTVHRGEALLSPAATRALIARFLARPDAGTPTAGALDALTEREREVLALVAAGLSNEDIAAHLVVSPHTAKTHVNRAMAKLGAHDRAQLVIHAYESGLVSVRRASPADGANPGAHPPAGQGFSR